MYNEIVSAYEQPIKFITGFAGSGKSTHLAQHSDSKTMVLTPTHKAADVLREKGMKHVYTIHSILRLVPTINMNFRRGQKLQKLKKVGDTDLKDITTIIIDEFSMINTQILDLLLELLPGDAQVVIYGDPYQLPPVDGDIIDPLVYTDDIVELNVQYRVTNLPVVETFMRFVDYIREVGTSKNLTMHKDIPHGTLEAFNPETDRILAYTNKRVLELNTQAAQFLKLPEEISVGELIFMNDMLVSIVEPDYVTKVYPACMSKGRLKEGSDLFECTAEIEFNIRKYNTNLSNYEQMTVDIDGQVYQIYYDLDHYATTKKLKHEVEKYQYAVIEEHDLNEDINLSKWCAKHKSAKYVRERGRAWSNYLTHQNLIFNVRRPFATTVHKAQGSEFSTIFIDQQDIKKSIKPGYYEQYARLMYVALSRAIDKVVLL